MSLSLSGAESSLMWQMCPVDILAPLQNLKGDIIHILMYAIHSLPSGL